LFDSWELIQPQRLPMITQSERKGCEAVFDLRAHCIDQGGGLVPTGMRGLGLRRAFEKSAFTEAKIG